MFLVASIVSHLNIPIALGFDTDKRDLLFGNSMVVYVQHVTADKVIAGLLIMLCNCCCQDDASLDN